MSDVLSDTSFRPNCKTAKVLLVDDEPANLLVCEAILSDLDAVLVKVRSGEEAVTRVVESEFAVVLLDVRMHGLDGFATAQLIRRRERGRQTPIIFTTAYENDSFSAEKAYSLGAVDYLVKPLVPAIVRAKVAGFIDLFQKAEQIKLQAERIRQMETREFERRLAAENARLKESEQALRESEQRFAQFMKHLVGLAWIKDDEGRYIYANDAAINAFQVSRETLYGKKDADIFSPDTAALFTENDRQARTRQTGVQVVETLNQADGVHHSIVSKFPIPGPENRGVFVGGMAIDITDRIRAEEELRRNEAASKEAERRKDEFLAILAHELRNPLAPIRNAVEILGMPNVPPADSESARQMMQRQVQHLVRMVDDLLDLSRITRGKIDLRTEPIPLATALARGVETSRPLIDAEGHRLVVTEPPASLTVDGDLVRLAQVVGNLLNNASRYTERGGTIWLTAGEEEGQAAIRVRDTGIGIAPELLPHIFDMFVQAGRPMKNAQSGLGIGLALVRKIVELHGGTVDVASPGLGQGSEFVVRLPIVCQRPRSEPVDVRQIPANPEARRILIVDDNRDAADSLAMILKLESQNVDVGYDGPSGVRFAQEHLPDIIFLDLGMPGMDGFEVARRLRADSRFENTLLVALTGWGNQEDLQRTKNAGFDAHLIKPADVNEVKSLLTRRRDAAPISTGTLGERDRG